MNVSRIIILLLTLFFTTSCSLYQSEGREFLEKQAFSFKNQSLSVPIAAKLDNCIETVNMSISFFDNEHWVLVATSFDPSWSIFEDQEPTLFTAVVAYTPKNQRQLFACEFIYDTEEEMLNRQRHDLQQALETIQRMLN